jgi:acyl carrier protein
MMWNRDKIKDLVLLEIKKYAPKVNIITEDTRILADLKFLSDDATYLALTLQRKVGARPSLEAWETVETVGDVIDLIMDYLPKDMQ